MYVKNKSLMCVRETRIKSTKENYASCPRFRPLEREKNNFSLLICSSHKSATNGPSCIALGVCNQRLLPSRKSNSVYVRSCGSARCLWQVQRLDAVFRERILHQRCKRTLHSKCASNRHLFVHASADSNTPQPRGSAMKVLCPDCRGQGHSPCVECDRLSPNPKCYTCSGWGVLLCPSCGGNGTLSMSTSSSSASKWDSPTSARSPDRYARLQRLGAQLAEESWRVVPLDDRRLRKPAPKSRSAKSTRTMSALHKAKIGAANKGRGKGVPKSEDHKRKIARAMQASFADPEHRAKISAAHQGKQKRCSVCGQLGHNVRSCPQTGQFKPPVRLIKLPPKEPKERKVPCCSICGETGHNKQRCPLNPKVSRLKPMRRTADDPQKE